MNSEARHRHIAKLEEVIARGKEAQRLMDDLDKRLEAGVLPFIEEEQNETNAAEVREVPARRFSGMLQQDAIMEVLRGTDGRVTLDELMAELEGGGLTPPRKSVVSCLSRATKAGTIQKYGRGVWGTEGQGNPESYPPPIQDDSCPSNEPPTLPAERPTGRSPVAG